MNSLETRLLDRIMSMNRNRTFDRTTDSLEAIANALGIGPSVGLWMFGIVDATQAASDITIITNNLQNVPNDLLEGQFWMQVIYNTSTPTTAPEGEFRRITNFVQGGALQTFTVGAFTADVEAGDMVAIFHESLLSMEILAHGTLNTSSTTVPEDSSRPEGVDYFKGCLLMTTEGAVRFQPRRIVTSSAAGVFTLDPSNPFTDAPDLVDYVIISGQAEFIPGVDAVVNRTPADIQGGKTDTLITAPDDVSSQIRYLKGILAAIGLAADAGDLATLFGRHKKVIEAVHVHVLLVVGDTTAMVTDLDTALKDFLEDKGYDVVVADPTDVAGNLELHYDVIVISASCDATHVGNLTNLRTALCPVICHSALIAVSSVLNLGATASSEAAQTQIEIIDNTVQWLIDQATGDLTVTASATIYKMETKIANAITLAETATGSANAHLTMVLLPQGLDDGGTPAYAPDFDRYFIGVANFTEINAVFTAILEELYDHVLHEVRYSPESIVTPKRVYQENIPDTDASDTATVTENDCILLEIGPRQNRRFSLRDFRLKAQADPAGNTMTVKLYEYFDGVLTEVDSFDIDTTLWSTYHSLMDMFGVPQVHSDAIKITCQMDAGTLEVKATYSNAEAKK